MAKLHKYGVADLKRDFPDEATCLKFMFEARHSRKCSCGGRYNPIKGRKQYQCSKCRFQIAPTAGTIFHKSDTPLTSWFYALFAFSNAKSGLSAKQLERDLNITYKTAWRMLSLIRKALYQGTEKLTGDVEMDAAYFGGRRYAGKNNKQMSRAMKAKAVVTGAVARKGLMRAKVTPDMTSYTFDRFLAENVEKTGTRLMTDKTNRLDSVAYGYERHSVDHSRREFVRGDVHVNRVEGFWSHVKRSIKGTHKVISKRHLQAYLDGFVFHWNNRSNDRERFHALAGAVLPVLVRK